MPFSTGMEMSSTTTSGSSRAASSTSACPLPTVLSTSKCGSRCRATAARKSPWSSAKSTLIRTAIDPGPFEDPTRGNGITWSVIVSGPKRLPDKTDSRDRGGQGEAERELQRDDALLDGELDQLGAGFDAEIFHHAVFVERDGPCGDLEDAGDLLHRSSLGQQLQHLPLAQAQLARRLPRFGLVQEIVHHVPRGQRRDVRTPLDDVGNRLEKLGGRRVLEQEAGRAGASRAYDTVGVSVVSLRGTRTWSWVPRDGCESIAISPPRGRTRSRMLTSPSPLLPWTCPGSNPRP